MVMPSGCAVPTSMVLMAFNVLRVEHRHRLAADEAMARLRIDDGSVSANAGEFARWFERIEVIDHHAIGNRLRRDRTAGDIQPSAVGISVDVVPAPLPADAGGLEDFVRAARPAAARRLGRRQRGLRPQGNR